MILRPREVVDECAPHYVGAIVSAVTAAASITAQQIQAAKNKRDMAAAAQAAKQGINAAPGGGSVAGTVAAGIGAGGDAAKQMLAANLKTENNAPSAATANAFNPPSLPQGKGSLANLSQSMNGATGPSLQQALGGQQPDLAAMMQNMGTGF